jgi:hypothetical protein
MNQTKFSIIFGTAFSVFSIPFVTIWVTLVLGAIGAVGAWIGTKLCQFIYKKITGNV